MPEIIKQAQKQVVSSENNESATLGSPESELTEINMTQHTNNTDTF